MLAILAFLISAPLMWLVGWLSSARYGGRPVQQGFRTRSQGFANYHNPYRKAYASEPLSVASWNLGWRMADYFSRFKIGRLLINYRVPHAYEAGRVARGNNTSKGNPYTQREEVRSWNDGWRDEDVRRKG